ncbi:TolC family protein [Glaesserella parasuis]|nr:TolC family protein [Glaesserella parasuis]
MKFIRKNAVSCIMLSSFLSISTYANPLKTILQQNLSNAPEVKEALANVEAAQNRVEQSKSQHFPIVSVTGSKTLRQYHKYEDNYGSTKIIPGIQAEMNIFAFGAIEKDIERCYKEKEYYKHTYTATQEEIAYTIGQLYLTALNMKEAISVMEKSLFRHQQILQDLDIIMENDEGRESEFVQAETRMLMAQQEINNYRQNY